MEVYETLDREKWKKVGTIRLGKKGIIYDLPEELEQIMRKPKSANMPDKDYLDVLIGSFLHSSTINFKLEEGEKR